MPTVMWLGVSPSSVVPEAEQQEQLGENAGAEWLGNGGKSPASVRASTFLAANKICLCFREIFVDKRRPWQAGMETILSSSWLANECAMLHRKKL